ncbi:hypothetical protein D4S03_09790 [bacterium]|nr:MAG: hypothetical protein D4S03_09790 [bacterium]
MVNNPRLYGLISLIYLITTFCFSPLSFADELKSPAFEIQMSTINITGGRKSNESGTVNLTDTVGQTFQGQLNSAGYVILAGFQYINTLIPFSFKISDLDINFGSLVPGAPGAPQTNVLTVTTGSAFGYSVKAIEDHPLRRSDGVTTIPDTSCDLATPCVPTNADVWADNSRYGFGYNMAGADVDTNDFVGSTYYRPFPVQNIDDPAIVMSDTGIATSSAATVSYKVNIDGAQAAGTYQNSIQYIAIPAF